MCLRVRTRMCFVTEDGAVLQVEQILKHSQNAMVVLTFMGKDAGALT